VRRRVPVLLATAVAVVFLAPRAGAQAPVYLVTPAATPCLNVRPEPRTTSDPFDCVVPGSRVSVDSSVPYWRRVVLADGRRGWAAKKFLALETSPQPADSVPSIPSNAWLEVHVVDVGQGDGIWIRTHDDGIAGNGVFEGRNIVIDGGPDASDAKNEMRRYLEDAGHHDAIIDALIVTHPHDDHYPGARGLLRHFEVASYYDPGFPKGGVEYPAFRAAVDAETVAGAPTRRMIGRASFDQPAWGREVKAEFVWAWPGSNTGLGSDDNTRENNASIVLRLTYGGHVFLFMGDAEGKDRDDDPGTPKYAEKALLDSLGADGLRATVLKLGHHGSETSSTLPFIAAVNPEVIVVSSGRRSFGGRFLPDESVLQRYCQHNPAVRIVRTDANDAAAGRTTANDQDGDHVVIRTNGTQLEVRARVDGADTPVGSCQP
jgi:beta-lactamase superfamily II metal-dependent hydrolase